MNKIDKKEPISVAFLDLAKAFDTLDHQILLNKLNRYESRGHALKLIESYLSDRKQMVKITGIKSTF